LEEDERLRVLADAASEAIVVLDKGTVLFVNRTLIDMLGMSGDPDQLMGFNTMELDGLSKYIAPESLADAHHLATTVEDIDFSNFPPFTVDILRSDGTSLTVWVKGKTMEYGGRAVDVALLRDSSWEEAAAGAKEDPPD
jgi:PAS domain S-box-containing protein